MQALFASLTHAVEGAPGVALAAALAWGVLSVLLSPCHLAGIPLIVGFIAGQGEMTTRRAFWTASSFAFGILVTIAAIGALTAALGRMAGDLGGWVNYAVAAIFFLVGLHLVGVIPLNFAGAGQVNMRRRGLLAALILGLVFGIALGPCTFAYMAPVLAAAFRVAPASPITAAGLLLAYGIGHCAVIVAAGTSAEAVQRYLKWNEGSRGMAALKAACGVLVMLGGLYMLYTA
ncbi:MAG: cytochrome C biogenesis protein [Armatimonadetes bacterium]|nr:cytochrome C biogenesis protein [Armatimonadota bacterium]